MTYPDERIDRWLIASTVLHIALFALIILSPNLFPRIGTSWGTPNGGTGGISAKIVTSISGVPLKTPEVVNETAPANDSPGFYKSEPAPTAAPDKTAEPVPEPNAPVKTTPKPKPPAPAAKSTPAPETKSTPAPETKSAPAPAAKSTPAPETPSNAVPYGQGGRPSLAYGQFSTGAGEAGIGFGDTSFGDRYGTYVNAITRAISNNWLKSLVDASVQKAPRVYLSFTIGRDGTVSDVEVKQSSGNPSLDRSAKRAVLASNPLPALPADYRGGNISVSFYFEYSR
jgi:TonB family protein